MCKQYNGWLKMGEKSMGANFVESIDGKYGWKSSGENFVKGYK